MYIRVDLKELEKQKKELMKIREECQKKYQEVVAINQTINQGWEGDDVEEYKMAFENGKAKEMYNKIDRKLLEEINRLEYAISSYEAVTEDIQSRANSLKWR